MNLNLLMSPCLSLLRLPFLLLLMPARGAGGLPTPHRRSSSTNTAAAFADAAVECLDAVTHRVPELFGDQGMIAVMGGLEIGGTTVATLMSDRTQLQALLSTVVQGNPPPLRELAEKFICAQHADSIGDLNRVCGRISGAKLLACPSIAPSSAPLPSALAPPLATEGQAEPAALEHLLSADRKKIRGWRDRGLLD